MEVHITLNVGVLPTFSFHFFFLWQRVVIIKCNNQITSLSPRYTLFFSSKTELVLTFNLIQRHIARNISRPLNGSFIQIHYINIAFIIFRWFKWQVNIQHEILGCQVAFFCVCLVNRQLRQTTKRSADWSSYFNILIFFLVSFSRSYRSANAN